MDEVGRIWDEWVTVHPIITLTVVPFVWHLIVFWAISLLFYYRDYNRLKKDKLQKVTPNKLKPKQLIPSKQYFVSHEELSKCARVALFNQFCILLPILL